jgi:hypothetical protein
MITVESIKGINVGSYGQVIAVTCVDADGVVQDVSGYTTMNAVAVSPDGRKTVVATVTYTSSPGDGTTGLVQWSFANGDIDRPGIWTVQLEFSKTNVMAKSYTSAMEVGEAVR